MNVGYCFCVTYVQQLHLKSVITAVGKASHTCGFVHFATGIHSKLGEDKREFHTLSTALLHAKIHYNL